MTRRPWSARRQACEELARMLASEPGLHEARLLQLLGLLDEPAGAARGAAPPASPAAIAPGPVAIGIWQPREGGDGELLFERRAPDAETDALWAPTPVLTARKRPGVRRVCLLGESAAAGWFYAPWLTPALVLERQLRAAGADVEVIDLARVDLGQADLLALARAALQLGPDALVVYAGNNWGVHFRPADPPSTVSAHTAARAYRDGGAAALARITRQAVEHDAKQTVDALARIAAGVPVVLVVPEVNLRDWERARPVPWLPGDATARWHEAYDRALAAAERGDWGAAGDLARQMVALDGGGCATSHRLAAWAALARGDPAAAVEAARAEVDARSWDNHPHTPSATSAVQQVLRAGAAEHGFRCVDLPALFAAAGRVGGDAAVAGRELLLDYCHLTPRGMELAMSGVATALGGTLGQPAPGPPPAAPAAVPPEADARAKWMSALYAAHWSTRRCGERGVVAYWIERALEAWPEIADEMRDYALSRCERPAWLHLSRRHQAMVATTGGTGSRLRRVRSLDPAAVEAVADALERRGVAVREPAARALETGAALPDETDLLDPAYYWNVVDAYDARSAFTHPRLAFYRALWPVSRFALPSDGRRSPRLRLTARLPAVDGPRAGELEVALGSTPLARVALSERWSTTQVDVPDDVARPGLNQLVLRWPALPASGDAAMREITTRLELGVPTDLHPAFGELSAFAALVR